jgi:hypothetical protein
MGDSGSDQPVTRYRLDDEQRLRVLNCLAKDDLLLSRDRSERLISDVEEAIDDFNANAHEGSVRDGFDALRDIFLLSHDDDPPVGVLRARIQKLPRAAVEIVDQRAPIVIPSLFPDEGQVSQFQLWARTADPEKLIRATQAISARGAKWVEGRRRGAAHHSRPRIEPITMTHIGGRPTNTNQEQLVSFLALAWTDAIGSEPAAGRSDCRGFGDLVHCVFQWLRLPQGGAAFALRQYWTEVRRAKQRRVSQSSTEHQR